jgi:hypothetical protein
VLDRLGQAGPVLGTDQGGQIQRGGSVHLEGLGGLTCPSLCENRANRETRCKSLI